MIFDHKHLNIILLRHNIGRYSDERHLNVFYVSSLIYITSYQNLISRFANINIMKCTKLQKFAQFGFSPYYQYIMSHKSLMYQI